MQLTVLDGHNTGLFSWEHLYKLGNEQAALWDDYLARLHAAGFAGGSGREVGRRSRAPRRRIEVRAQPLNQLAR